MSDKEHIPDLNGTINALVGLIATPMDTQEQQAQALRESMKLQLHTYMIQKQMLDKLIKLLDERQGIITRIIDKGLVPILVMMLLAVLAMLFKSAVPVP